MRGGDRGVRRSLGAYRHVRDAVAAIIATSAVATMAACSSAAPHTSPVATPTPARTSPIPVSTPTPSPTAAVTLASCAAPVTRTALHVIHHFAVAPDDIAVDASGRLWVSAREANQLISMNQDGTGIATIVVGGGPEGVAASASGIYVAQQNINAIEQVRPQRHALITFPNDTVNAGIDGIAVGATSQTLIIPDSPNGTLIEMSLAGAANPRVIATRLGRPVAAAVGPSGEIFVANESTPGLVVVTPSGAVTRIGSFTYLDEVVAYAGLLYVTELDRHDVVAVDPATGASLRLAVNLPAPQGLAVTATGTLEIVDATTDTLYSLPTCGAA